MTCLASVSQKFPHFISYLQNSVQTKRKHTLLFIFISNLLFLFGIEEKWEKFSAELIESGKISENENCTFKTI